MVELLRPFCGAATLGRRPKYSSTVGVSMKRSREPRRAASAALVPAEMRLMPVKWGDGSERSLTFGVSIADPVGFKFAVVDGPDGLRPFALWFGLHGGWS